MNAKVRDVMTPDPIGVDYHQSIGETARTMRDWTKKMIPGTISLKRLAEADVDG